VLAYNARIVLFEYKNSAVEHSGTFDVHRLNPPTCARARGTRTNVVAYTVEATDRPTTVIITRYYYEIRSAAPTVNDLIDTPRGRQLRSGIGAGRERMFTLFERREKIEGCSDSVRARSTDGISPKGCSLVHRYRTEQCSRRARKIPLCNRTSGNEKTKRVAYVLFCISIVNRARANPRDPSRTISG